MNLQCLKCGKTYNIPVFIMKIIGYRRYSYCRKCYRLKKKGGKR